MLYLAKEYFGALLNEQAHPTCPTPRPRSLVSRVPYATSGCNCSSRIPVGPRKWRAVVRLHPLQGFGIFLENVERVAPFLLQPPFPSPATPREYRPGMETLTYRSSRRHFGTPSPARIQQIHDELTPEKPRLQVLVRCLCPRPARRPCPNPAPWGVDRGGISIRTHLPRAHCVRTSCHTRRDSGVPARGSWCSEMRGQDRFDQPTRSHDTAGFRQPGSHGMRAPGCASWPRGRCRLVRPSIRPLPSDHPR